MFGYVTPYKMELKIKDYEKFKSYYCGLCKSIKTHYGNIPRMSLNYDITFLAILLDSLNDEKPIYKKEHCIVHPIRKKIILQDNSALAYAAFSNTILFYYKLLDDINDDNSLKSKLLCPIFKKSIKKSKLEFQKLIKYIEDKLKDLYNIEHSKQFNSLDEISHPFAQLTGYILSYYKSDNNKVSTTLFNLGYNLGKWIYIIDALDDLEKDMKKNNFNPINILFNKESNDYETLKYNITDRLEFILLNCSRHCLSYLNELNLQKNKELLFNIFQYGMIDKMNKVFKRSDLTNE